MKIWMTAFIVFGLTFGTASFVVAQEDPKLNPTEELQQKEKAEKEKKAYALLEQVVDEAQLLRLTENRVRVQIGAADLLWEHNEGRARTLFALAAEGLAEMMRSANPGPDERRGPNRGRTSGQLRQDLILAVARYDVTLAYQLLAATRLPTPPANTNNSRFDSEDNNLEERLLAQVAQLDPKLALQNAEQMLDKGQYSRSLAQVLSQLQAKDKDAAAKLEDKLVKRLQSTTIISTPDAGNLALSLLRSGPRLVEGGTTPTSASLSNSELILTPASYASLLGNVIDAALKAVPPPTGNQRGANNSRGRRGGPGGGGGQNNSANEPSAAELEQANARRLLGGLQAMLPQIDQYLPGRAQAVRQKTTELGITDNSRAPMAQMARAMQQGTSDSLLQAAPSAPQMMQSRIYQQAALRALEEGNVDRARQIANDHLEAPARESVLQAVEFRQTSEKAAGTQMSEVRQTLAGLRSDDERIDLLVRLAGSARQNNPKLAVELLNEARQFTNRRATNYRQLEQQLTVADAFRQLEPARSFEILEPGIAQLNELLTAAATLNGFEVNVFQEGELPLEGRSGLSNIVSRYGQVLGLLSISDFDQAQTLANRFQLSESRIVARLSIVRSMLGKEQGSRSRGSRFDQNTFIRRGR